jgi:hypothetical protein
MNTNTITGGWTEYQDHMSTKEEQIFSQATKDLMGVNYEPVAVATQVVSGTNYRFFCNATPVYPNAPHEATIVEVYEPLNGQPQLREIKRVDM